MKLLKGTAKKSFLRGVGGGISYAKMIKVPPQIMTSYDRNANERPVYTVIDQW